MNRWLFPLIFLAGCYPRPQATWPVVPTVSQASIKSAKSKALPVVTLAWDPSPSPDVSGYRIYAGDGSRVYTNALDVGPVTISTVSNLVPGALYYFTVTAYNLAGLESEYDGEVSYRAPAPPEPPLNLRIEAQVASSPAGPWQTFTNWIVARSESNQFWKLQIKSE